MTFEPSCCAVSGVMRLLRVVLPLALLLAGKPAWAENALIERYEAPAGCPTALWFEGELRRRTPTPTVWDGAVRVRVEARGGGFVGHVERMEASSASASRDVEHESCEQVVRALALIAALMLSPSGPQPRGTETESRAEGAPREPLAKPGLTPNRMVSRTQRPSAKSEPNARDWRFAHAAALGLAVQSSVAPTLRLGPRLGYRLVLARARSESEIGVSFTRMQSGSLTVDDVGSAELVYSAGRLELCHTLSLTAALWLGPCGMLDVGELRGRGWASGQDSVTRSGLWFSPGLLGKLEVRPRRPLFLELALGSFLPLYHPEFHFTVEGRAREIYKPPNTLGFTGNVSVGVRFP